MNSSATARSRSKPGGGVPAGPVALQEQARPLPRELVPPSVPASEAAASGATVITTSSVSVPWALVTVSRKVRDVGAVASGAVTHKTHHPAKRR